MKKKYYIVLISFAVLLIASMVFIIVLNNKLVDKTQEDNYYSICGQEIKTIAYSNDVNLTMSAYSYTTNSSIHTKTYEYETDNAVELISHYTEYLVADENFINTSAGTQDSYAFSKTISGSDDIFKIELTFTENSIGIILEYTYVD